MNTFGTLYRLTSFGESHGTGIGGILDGVPAGIKIDRDSIQAELTRRRPGQSDLTTARDEKDTLEILSGLQDGITLGTPIGFFVQNTNARPKDYDTLSKTFRPGQADFTYKMKYGIRSKSGGGRSSARETIARVVSGAVGKQILTQWHEIKIFSKISEIKGEKSSSKFESIILNAKKQGESVGGVIECTVKNMPVGLGAPIFDRLEADLAKAMLSLPATKGFEIGDGFASTQLFGSEHNDEISVDKDGKIQFLSNHAGGVLGGISNGSDLVFRVAFKPVSTVQTAQKTITEDKKNTTIKNIGGRHDPCVLPRALPIVEAMTAHVLLDHSLRNQSSVPKND